MTPQSLPYIRRTLAVPLLLGSLLAACGGGGGGGSPAVKVEVEPNDTSATATPLNIGVVGTGDVDAAGDLDFWAVHANANTFVKIEVFGTRMDHSTWDTNANVPNIVVYDTDGTTMLLEHDFSGFLPGGAWSWGEHDLDIPLVRVGATGTYFIRIGQDDATLPGGKYAIKVSTVPVSGVQIEAEPIATTGVNDTPATAQTITPGTVYGFHVDNESDYYKFHVSSPSTVRFEMTAYRNGPNNGDDDDFDTELVLFDTDGTTSLFDDDDAFFYDSAIQYQINTPGDYFILVEECCGAGDATYSLKYTSTPVSGATESEPNDDTAHANAIAYGGSIKGTIDTGEDDFYRFNGTKGDMVRLQLFDSSNCQGKADFVNLDMLATDGTTSLSTGGDGGFQTFTTILQETGTFYIHITPSGALTDYRLELTKFKSATYETEANDTPATADTLTTSAAGIIDTAGDKDVYRFQAAKDRLVTIQIYAEDSDAGGLMSDGFFEYSGHGSDLDPLLTVFDTDGTTTLASSTIAALDVTTECITDGLPTTAVSFVAPSSGTFYVQVESASGSGSATNYYVITKR
jgi:hypothetical protein